MGVGRPGTIGPHPEGAETSVEGGRRQLFCFAMQSRRRRKKAGDGCCGNDDRGAAGLRSDPIHSRPPVERHLWKSQKHGQRRNIGLLAKGVRQAQPGWGKLPNPREQRPAPPGATTSMVPARRRRGADEAGAPDDEPNAARRSSCCWSAMPRHRSTPAWSRPKIEMTPSCFLAQRRLRPDTSRSRRTTPGSREGTEPLPLR